MKKVFFVFLFLLSLVSCNRTDNKLFIYNGMTKNELLSDYKITADDFHDLGEFVLVKNDKDIYVVKFNKKNKLENYEVVRMKNNIKKNREEYSKSLDKIDFYYALSMFGFPENTIHSSTTKDYQLYFYLRLENFAGGKTTYIKLNFEWSNELFYNS